MTFTSSEITTNFVVTDISVSGGSLSSFTGSNKVYTATFTPSQDGDCTINVDANKFTDAAGNGNSAATEFNWKYDSTVPSAFNVGTVVATGGTVVSNYWNSTNTGLTIVVPIANDTTLTNGTIQLRGKVDNGNYENLGTTYTIVTEDINTSKTLSVTSGQFEALNSGIQDGEVITITAIITDAADNTTTGTASQNTITIDQTLPTMTITSTTSGVTDGSTTNDSTISLTFTSSEITTDFAAEDISVSGGSLSDFTGSNKVYTATFTPSQDGDCTINVNANKFKDTAGNGNSAATEFNWKYDNTNPATFTVGTVISTVGTIVSNYWNSTNTGLNVTVPVSDDSTLVNGTIQLKAKKQMATTKIWVLPIQLYLMT